MSGVHGVWLMRSIFAMNLSSYSGGIYAIFWLVMDKTNGYKAKDSYYYWTVMYRLLKNAYYVNRECSKNNGNVCQ